MSNETKAVGGLDFTAVEALQAREEEGYTFDVVGPDGEVLLYNGDPVTITVCGTFSTTYQDLEDDFNRTWLMEELEKLPKGTSREAAMDAVWAKRERAHDAMVRAKCISGWHGVVRDGEPLGVNDDTRAFIMSVPWLRTQVRNAQVKHEGFTPAGSSD